MSSLTYIATPEYWLDQMFATNAAQEGAVLRRSRAWVDREIGRALFVEEVRRRGFHLLSTKDQFIIVCQRDPVKLLF